MLLLFTDSLMERTKTCKNGFNVTVIHLMDSLFQAAAWRRDRLAQILGTFILNPVGGQINELQGLVLPQHLSQMVDSITGHVVAVCEKGRKNRFEILELDSWGAVFGSGSPFVWAVKKNFLLKSIQTST